MTETTQEVLGTALREWGELATDAWVIIASASDWNATHPDWQKAAERWRDRLHAMAGPGSPLLTDMATLWAIAGKPVPDGAEHGPAAAVSGESVSLGGPRDGDSTGAPGAAQPPGEYARVELPGYVAWTGWVTEETLAGSGVLVIRDDAGCVQAKVSPAAYRQYIPLDPPVPGSPKALLAIGAGYEPGGSGGFEDEGDHEDEF